MADDSLEIKKDDVPFHPCLTPRGMTWYNLNVLTALQQKLLNDLKTDTIRENNHYLANHPEVRALIVIFLRGILRDKPKLKSVSDFAKDFFSSRPVSYIQAEVDEYLKMRGEPLNKQGDSAVNVQYESPTHEPSLEDKVSLFRKDYYSWDTSTFTNEPCLVGEADPEWGSYGYDDLPFGGYPSTSGTFTTFGTNTTERRDFERLFASRATPYYGESLEASTVSLTKEYMQIFGGARPEAARSSQRIADSLAIIADEEREVDDLALDKSSYEGSFDDDDDKNPSSILADILAIGIDDIL